MLKAIYMIIKLCATFRKKLFLMIFHLQNIFQLSSNNNETASLPELEDTDESISSSNLTSVFNFDQYVDSDDQGLLPSFPANITVLELSKEPKIFPRILI